jgi:hypothetical protein
MPGIILLISIYTASTTFWWKPETISSVHPNRDAHPRMDAALEFVQARGEPGYLRAVAGRQVRGRLRQGRTPGREPSRPGSSHLPLPRRVRELVIGRLERVSDPARQLAGVAAVIGREFDFPLVQRAAGFDDGAAAQAVEELVRRHIFRGTGEVSTSPTTGSRRRLR